MKYALWIAVFLFLFAGHTFARSPVKDCSLTLSFGSYAMGTDHALGKQMESYFKDNANYREITRSNWGKEGEYTLCVQVADISKTRTLYTEIAKLINKHTTKRGPTCVMLTDVERSCSPERKF